MRQKEIAFLGIACGLLEKCFPGDDDGCCAGQSVLVGTRPGIGSLVVVVVVFVLLGQQQHSTPSTDKQGSTEPEWKAERARQPLRLGAADADGRMRCVEIGLTDTQHNTHKRARKATNHSTATPAPSCPRAAPWGLVRPSPQFPISFYFPSNRICEECC